MRLTLVGPVYPYRGGIAHYTAMLSQACLRRGHELQVMSFRRQYPAFLYPGASDKDPSRDPLKTPAEYLLDPLYPWTWLAAARSIQRFSPRLVVVMWWTTFWALPYAVLGARLRRAGIPLVYLVHNVLPHEQRPWDIPLARLAFRTASAFIVQAEHEQRRLAALFPGAPIALSPHPVYTFAAQGFPDHRLGRAAARQRLSLPPDRPVLLFFGIVRRYKGLDVLLDALSILRQEGISPILLICGEIWEDKAAYLQKIHALGLDESVRLDDRYIPNEEIAPLFSAADLLAAPYTAGTQSGAANLALGFGLPMVITEQVAAGIPDRSLSTALIVPPSDARALAAALRRAITDPPPAFASPAPAEDNWKELVQVIESFSNPANRTSEKRIT